MGIREENRIKACTDLPYNGPTDVYELVQAIESLTDLVQKPEYEFLTKIISELSVKLRELLMPLPDKDGIRSDIVDFGSYSGGKVEVKYYCNGLVEMRDKESKYRTHLIKIDGFEHAFDREVQVKVNYNYAFLRTDIHSSSKGLVASASKLIRDYVKFRAGNKNVRLVKILSVFEKVNRCIEQFDRVGTILGTLTGEDANNEFNGECYKAMHGLLEEYYRAVTYAVNGYIDGMGYNLNYHITPVFEILYSYIIHNSQSNCRNTCEEITSYRNETPIRSGIGIGPYSVKDLYLNRDSDVGVRYDASIRWNNYVAIHEIPYLSEEDVSACIQAYKDAYVAVLGKTHDTKRALISASDAITLQYKEMYKIVEPNVTTPDFDLMGFMCLTHTIYGEGLGGTPVIGWNINSDDVRPVTRGSDMESAISGYLEALYTMRENLDFLLSSLERIENKEMLNWMRKKKII